MASAAYRRVRSFMHCLSPFVCLTIIAAASCAVAREAGDAETITLGGPRKATAEIVADAENFNIAVGMIAVRVFDRAMNDLCNRDKAMGYAFAALTQHLAPETRKASLSISGKQVIDSGYEGRIYRLVLRIPRDGVRIAAVQRKRRASAKRAAKRVDATADTDQQPKAASTSSFFTVKQDYLDTIDVLSAKWREQLPSKPEDKADAEGFYGLIADAEDGITNDFAALAKEVKSDKKLLSIEAKEVLTVAHDRENHLVRQMADSVKAFDKEPSGGCLCE